MTLKSEINENEAAELNRVATSTNRGAHRPRQSVGSRIIGFFGELLITLGIVLMLYVVWELWWTNIDSAQAQQEVTNNLVENLGEVVIPDISDEDKDFGPAPVTEIDLGETFGIMYFPSWGKSGTYHPVTQGVGDDVIDSLGIGHYPNTQLPGEQGNFAVAAHRQTHGQVFWDIDQLQEGDKIYLQTKEGYYTYSWSKTEIVNPSDGDVLLPVPHQPGAEANASILTMTTCHPKYTTRQRMIAYSELTDWRPLEAGPPSEIRDLVAKAAS